MEDEDFGFTKREEHLLRNVLKDNEPVREKREDREIGGRSLTAAPSSGAAEAGSEVPARPPAASSSSSASSVAPDPSNKLNTSDSPIPPNIPNVVEYHLKVKPSPSSRASLLDVDPRKSHGEDMRKEKSPESETNKKRDLVSKLSRLSIDSNVFEGSTDLPQVFQAKYLGSHDARGLWGIKHTRRPVDNMVAAAKALPTNTMLPLIKLVVSREGVALLPLDKRKHDSNSGRVYPIETISYGVQDLVYTRVFSMIVVRETENFRRVSPFECHGFVCESKHHARQLTYALATAFEIYSRTVKAQDKMAEIGGNNAKKRFAIDLRSPEEIEADLAVDSEA